MNVVHLHPLSKGGRLERLKRGGKEAKKDEKKVLKKFCEKLKSIYLCCPAGKSIERLTEKAERVETKGFCLKKMPIHRN